MLYIINNNLLTVRTFTKEAGNSEVKVEVKHKVKPSAKPEASTSLEGGELNKYNELLISGRKEINKSVSFLNQNRISPEHFDEAKFIGGIKEIQKRLIALSTMIETSIERSKVSNVKLKASKSKKE
jgi:hypothetical protein